MAVIHAPARCWCRQRKNGKHRAAWDATFNAPKSVSLQVLIGGDERLREAHRQAVQHALTELETVRAKSQ